MSGGSKAPTLSKGLPLAAYSLHTLRVRIAWTKSSLIGRHSGVELLKASMSDRSYPGFDAEPPQPSAALSTAGERSPR